MQAADRSDLGNRSDASGSYRNFTPLQAFFLARLHDLIVRRQQQADQLPGSDWRLRLFDKALYSTYRDCVELGVGGEARDLLQRQKQAERS